MSGNSNIKGFFIGFFAGGTVGALSALLTTPKSGKAFRSDIKRKSDEYFNDADQYLADTKIKAKEYINEGKRKYAMIMNDIKSKPDVMLKDAERVFNDAKVKTKDALHSGKEKIETETERLKSSVKAGIDAYKEAKNT
jgi:gas vesicle protein